MLVLRRKPGQSIDIGGDIKVKIVRVDAQGVQVGIEAPPETLVLRSELRPTGDTRRQEK